MEFGIFHEFERAAGATDAQAFDDGFELVDAAERWGLDAVWLAELHWRRVLSAPLTVATAIAARTRRIRWTAVRSCRCVPLRLAEKRPPSTTSARA